MVNIKKTIMMAIAVASITIIANPVQAATYTADHKIFTDANDSDLFSSKIATSMPVGYAEGNEYLYNKLKFQSEKEMYRTVASYLSQGYIAIPYTALPDGFKDPGTWSRIATTDKPSASNVINAIISDHPELWWTTLFLGYQTAPQLEYLDGGIVIEPYDEIETLAEFKAIDLKMAKKFSAARAKIMLFSGNDASIMRDIALYCTKDLATYGHLCERTESKMQYYAACTTLGLLDKKLVCSGYSSFYIWAAHLRGIPVAPVFGIMTNKNNECHEWVMVYVQGEWHAFEATSWYLDYATWTYTADVQMQDHFYEKYRNTQDEKIVYAIPSFADKTKVVKPAKATGLKAVKKGKKTKLTWNRQSGVTGYRIYVSKNGGKTWTKVKTLAKNKATYTYGKYSKTYKYKVRAYVKTANITAWGKCSSQKSAK